MYFQSEQDSQKSIRWVKVWKRKVQQQMRPTFWYVASLSAKITITESNSWSIKYVTTKSSTTILHSNQAKMQNI